MSYINTETLTQYTESEIRAAFPNTSFPQPFTPPEGYAYVFPAPQPVYNTITQSVRRTAAELTGLGHWEQRWEVAALDADAVATNLEAARLSKRVAIRAERDRRKFNGVNVSGKWIHSDTYSRTQWMGMVMMGASIPAIEWTTMDGSTTTTSQALAGQAFQGIAQLDATLFAHAKSLIALVDASNDPATMDITTGWPATFGEVV